MNYYVHIRQIIYDHYERTDILNSLFDKGMEIETFSNIFKIKISLYTRYINNINLLKTDNDWVESIILGNEYEGKFAIMLDKYPKKIHNYYSLLRPISNKNKLNNDRLNDIKNRIINKYPNIKIA